jgi:preprotein translocase subunit SecF
MKIAKPAAIFSISDHRQYFLYCDQRFKLGLDFTGGISAELTIKQLFNQLR